MYTVYNIYYPYAVDYTLYHTLYIIVYVSWLS